MKINKGRYRRFQFFVFNFKKYVSYSPNVTGDKKINNFIII
jgi:hypothetical protein